MAVGKRRGLEAGGGRRESELVEREGGAEDNLELALSCMMGSVGIKG